MNRKAAMLIGAAALTAGPALAAPRAAEAPAVPVAASYAELLEPIPNAVERLKVSDAEAAARPARLIPAQYNQHHHHHHDSSWYRQNGYNWNGGRWMLGSSPHHHHHHNRWWYQRNGYIWNGGAWTLRPVHHRHHHHHHQNNY